MHRGDRRLQLVGADGPLASAPLDERDALGDRVAVPQRPVLLGERDQRAAGAGPRRAPGVGEQHEREQAGDLVVAGREPVQQPGQPDRLVGELGALQIGPGRGRVALVEDQVQDVLRRRASARRSSPPAAARSRAAAGSPPWRG